MCTSMVDIQSATAEIRRRKKEETGPKCNGCIKEMMEIRQWDEI